MSRTTRRILFTLGYVTVGLIAVVAVGGLTFHRQFFHVPEPMLSFLILGLMGALIYASVQMRGAWSAVLVIALWCIIEVAMNPGSLLSTAAATAVCRRGGRWDAPRCNLESDVPGPEARRGNGARVRTD